MPMRNVLVLIVLPIACGDNPPPCHPDGDPDGTVYGPTPTPLPGPGGPGDPPDHGDAPEKYSKNADGEVCRCSPYQMDCTTDPDDVDGDDIGSVSSVSGDCGTACNAGGGGDQQALLREALDDAQGSGGVTCINPTDCVRKCVAESKYCWAEHAAHPYKPDQMGDLYDCIDSFPKAKYGGSYTCLYRYPNGDACIFAYPTKLGPLTLPGPPPLCEYKRQ
jgi:hypothetical protein